jgi:23S rRNA pseudouridine1911/1915/1917 synthase
MMSMSDLQLSVIFESPDFVVLNKPSGVLVHHIQRKLRSDRDPVAPETTVTDWVLERYPEVMDVGDDPILRPGIVHRIDRDTSGVLVVARTQAFFVHLKSLFMTHQVKKEYWAIVFGELEEKKGIIDSPIGIKQGTVKRTIHGGRMIKEAVTEYTVAAVSQNFSWLKVFPKTGRTHQIRVHLASIGHPIVGDPLYCSKSQKQFSVDRLLLHAFAIEFILPNGNRVRFEADVPSDFSSSVPSFSFS